METDKIIISSVNDYMDMVKYVYQEWSENNKHLFFNQMRHSGLAIKYLPDVFSDSYLSAKTYDRR